MEQLAAVQYLEEECYTCMLLVEVYWMKKVEYLSIF